MAYRKTIVLDPILLHREELVGLETLIKSQLTDCKRCNFVINAVSHGHDLSAKPFHTMAELLEHPVPDDVDQLVIEARDTEGEDRIIKSIKFTADKGFADVRIYSADDLAWVNTTAAALEPYLTDHHPWYARLKRIIPPLSNMTMVLALFLASMVFKSGEMWHLLFPGLLLMTALTLLILSTRQLLFPHSRVNLVAAKEDRRENYELWASVAGGTLVLVSLIGAWAVG